MISCDPGSLLRAASCFSCLTEKKQREINTYLLCHLNMVGGFGANIIPPGSTYGGAATFNLTVVADTSYVIVWGANEVSMTLCGTNYPSTGVGTITTVYTAACTVMQFNGTFAGTTVTAIVKLATTIPIPSGFAFAVDAGGATATASWSGTHPFQVNSTELWTSTDGITYSLAATVNFPTASKAVTAPTPGNVLYAKIRWCSAVTCGSFTAAIQVTANQNLLTSLQSYWKLDENIANGPRLDSLGGNTLTDVGNNIVSAPGGKIGRCIEPNGTVSQRLNHADVASLAAGAGVSFTVAVWFNPDTAITANNPIIGKWNGALVDYMIWINTPGAHIVFLAENAANTLNNTADSGVIPVVGNWYFCTAGYDDSLQQIWIQVNAAARVSAALVGVRRSAANFTVDNYDQAGLASTRGKYDEMAFWHRSLSAAEITQLYNAGAGMTYPFS